MRLVHSQPHVPDRREVMRKVVAEWAAVSSAQAAARQCIDVLNGISDANTLEASDWSQIQKLAEHLVRARRARAGRD